MKISGSKYYLTRIQPLIYKVSYNLAIITQVIPIDFFSGVQNLRIEEAPTDIRADTPPIRIQSRHHSILMFAGP